MSDPFVYTPGPSYPEYQSSSYYPPGTPVGYHHSPFIPSLPLSSTSPYGSPYHRANSLPGSPYLGGATLPTTPNPKAVMFPTLDGYEPVSTWNQPQRPRRPSWHGSSVDPAAQPFYQSNYLSADSNGDYYRDRRRSFGADSGLPPWIAPPTSNWWAPPPSGGYIPPPTTLLIHPWLNGEAPRGDFVFDLSHPEFLPRRLVAAKQTVPISQQDLAQPATHPPISRLRIVCDAIPQWPIDLRFQPTYTAIYATTNPNDIPPISLADVLIMIHSSLHRRISHLDWAKLSISEETAVTKAYSRRCRAFAYGPDGAYNPEREDKERKEGVKRVDFLLGKVWMRGLRMTGEQGVMKLILG